METFDPEKEKEYLIKIQKEALLISLVKKRLREETYSDDTDREPMEFVL